MPIDVDMGRNLATQLGAATFSKSPTVEFTFDDYVESETIDGPVIRLDVDVVDRTRAARDRWAKEIAIEIVVYGPQKQNDQTGDPAGDEIEEWLDFTDEVFDFIQDGVVLSKRCISLENNERLDIEKLRDDAQFRSVAVATYKVL